AQIRAHDLAGSIGRNLHVIRGIPNVMARAREVADALAHLADGGLRSTEPRDKKISRMKADPQLRHLSRFLATAQVSLDVDVLYVADSVGDVVAASDFEREGKSVGTTLLDREYFATARSG